MNNGQGRTKVVVTRVFDGQRTPREAFVKLIVNAESENRDLKIIAGKDIITDKSTCGATYPKKGEENG